MEVQVQLRLALKAYDIMDALAAEPAPQPEGSADN
jgi:hypothetical protein